MAEAAVHTTRMLESKRQRCRRRGEHEVTEPGVGVQETKVTLQSDQRSAGDAPEGHAAAVTRWGGTSIAAKFFRQRELGIIGVAIVLFVLFSIFSHGTFDSFQTWGGIASDSAELGIVAVGFGFLMISGEFDLSVGANFAFAALVMAMMIHDSYSPIEGLLADLASASASASGC
jgi:ABC-type xylose transport system permease subunit